MSTAFGNFFAVKAYAAKTHVWAELQSDSEQWDAAALWLAQSIARSRCGNSSAYYDAWNRRRSGGPEHSEEQRDILIAHVASEAIGTRDEPAEPIHLQGFVAEFIWYELASAGDAPIKLNVVRIEEPSWSPTDSGGDGLVVYTIDGALSFCIWESKAHDGNTAVRDVVNGACRQLDKKAIRYLARMSKIGQQLQDDDLQAFYGRLAELWRHQAREAAGGVSVTTTSTDVAQCFANFGAYWSFQGRAQRQGLVVMINDFPKFAKRVREHLWSGL